MVKLLIFDLDGTLVDSAHDISTALNRILVERQMAPLHNDVIKAAIGEGFKKLLTGLFPDRQEDKEFIDSFDRDFMEYYDFHLLDTTKPYPGVEAFLKKTHLKIGIVTNKPYRYTEKTIKGLKLDQFPWLRIFGADSLEKRKPDPMPLIEMMRAAQVSPEETLMIGDGVPDMLAAKAAGVRAIACEFGYADLEMLNDLGAIASFSHYDQLPALIEELSHS